MNRSFSLAAAAVAAVLVASAAGAVQDAKVPLDTPKLDCKQCHTCEKPSPKETCLKVCPSLSPAHNGSVHRLAEGPDTVVLDGLADLYQAVKFNHREHARMSGMGADCATCHHYSPAGKVPPCKECHNGDGNPKNLRQPGLKGAYHRQCLACHREWNHETRCVLCHLPAAGKALAASKVDDATDIMGKAHPLLPEPVTKVYQTDRYKQGPVVTFHHKDHVELYGLKCANCHKEESCGTCHDMAKKPGPKRVRTEEQIHAVCKDCHQQDGCARCHGTSQKAGFSHSSVGFTLSAFHQRLDCRACHPTGKRIAKVSKECATCHAGWNQENFKHAVTGFTLDDTHSSADCTDCHPGRKFDQKTVCTSCHDDGRTAKKQPPGTFKK